ncbi:MAG: hypothetical protein JWN15_2488, partial [Firmicutes bacterium]|nr:hypothetical protein [Bacillota bacterium]
GPIESCEVEIRPLKSIEDCLLMQPVMARVWGPEFVVPDHLSFKIAKYGGVVLGAFINGALVGFTLSFPMHQNYLHGLYLHMIGVVPEYQSARVGLRLMLSLGRAAAAIGHRMVTWTYDPLESPNARLYIGKLGAICNEYKPNYYGILNDQRNRGAATDRFQVQWWVETPRIAMLLEQSVRGADPTQLVAAGLNQAEVGGDALAINDVSTRPDGLLVPGVPRLDLKGQDLLLHIPVDFHEIKQQDQELANCWRMQTRSVFTAYFARGWTATGFLRGDRFNTYVLQK